MPAPIPVHQQFTDKQKNDIKELWINGATQATLAAQYQVPRRTMMKLCAHLGLKRNAKEAAKVAGLKSDHDTEDNIAKIRGLRNSHSLAEIAVIIGCSTNAVNRLCVKYGIKLDKELYAEIQSERMKSAWTQEKREALSGSKYPELNDKDWLVEHYNVMDMSMGQIAKLVKAPLMIVSHHLRRHGITIKPKEQYLSKLRRESTRKRKVKTKWGEFTVQSIAEERFLESLSPNVQSVKVEPCTFSYGDMQYVPDFEVDGELVEVKPPEFAMLPGVNRQKFIKQKLIANHNGKDIKCWYYKGFQKSNGFYNIEPLSDVDRYFCVNWKLLFTTPELCFDFLSDYGFRPVKWAKDKLLLALNNMFKASGDNQLNANYPNPTVVNFITHFNDHYWQSTHKGYNSIASAFGPGNSVIIKDALQFLWNKTGEVNIYSLVRTIAKRYKDFTPVGIFKPWVARHVYDALLTNGGTIIDPCMGWGGRLLGTLDSAYNYIGYDLNSNVIDSHNQMAKFVGSRFTNRIEFNLADSAHIVWPKGDLLFTSPPYDDTEYYHGLSSQCSNTDSIYDNIMKFGGLVALNIPLRHQERCIAIAKKAGRELIREFKMKTANFMGREATYEPILVFK